MWRRVASAAIWPRPRSPILGCGSAPMGAIPPPCWSGRRPCMWSAPSWALRPCSGGAPCTASACPSMPAGVSPAMHCRPRRGANLTVPRSISSFMRPWWPIPATSIPTAASPVGPKPSSGRSDCSEDGSRSCPPRWKPSASSPGNSRFCAASCGAPSCGFAGAMPPRRLRLQPWRSGAGTPGAALPAGCDTSLGRPSCASRTASCARWGSAPI